MFLTIVRRFHLTSLRGAKTRPPSAPKYNFVDSAKLFVQGGAGGQGIKRFTAIGGKGGDVYFIGKLNRTLGKILSKGSSYKAGAGNDASKRRVLGDPGEDLLIPVPLGVTICDEEGKLIGDINKEGDKLLVARGAPGGGPRNDYVGRRAMGNHVHIDLKLMADVGMVGFPNAGKSTLLSRLSRASPKVANYPFTTLRPHIGVIEYQDLTQISVADLPGLIEGAHMNLGLGHEFLKHVERTKLLLFVIDVNGFWFKQKTKPRPPLETALTLMRELELFNPDLVSRRALLCLNKVDGDFDQAYVESVLQELNDIEGAIANRGDTLDTEIIPQSLVKFDAVVAISAANDINVETLIGEIRTAVDKQIAVEAEANLDPQDRRHRIHDFTFHLTPKSQNYLV